MHLLYLGSEDAYAVRRLREESKRRRIRFEVLRPEDIKLTTDRPTRFADALIIRTQHPRWIPHALTLARLYRKAGKLVADASLARDVTIYSKLNDVLVLAEHGVPVPRSILASARRSDIAKAAHTLGYPLVVKSIHGAGGEQVFLTHSQSDIRRLFRLPPKDPPLIRANGRMITEGKFMLQEYIPAPFDYRVLVIGYRALPVLLRRFPKRGDFRTNAHWVGRVDALPTRTLPTIQRTAERAARILKREFTGIDIRLKRGKPLVLEVNRQPEFETFEKTTEVNVAGVFLEYIAGLQ